MNDLPRQRPTFKELFEQAEAARMADRNEEAIDLYAQIEAYGERGMPHNARQLNHMWGVALLGADRVTAGLEKLGNALRLSRDPAEKAAVLRDMSRAYLKGEQYSLAHEMIDLSLELISRDNFAERGISLGFKARILLAEGKTLEALEMFGTADWLLRRGGNLHYELYNLLPFLQALLIEEHNLLDSYSDHVGVAFYEEAERAQHLARSYGNDHHRAHAHQLDRENCELGQRVYPDAS